MAASGSGVQPDPQIVRDSFQEGAGVDAVASGLMDEFAGELSNDKPAESNDLAGAMKKVSELTKKQKM